MQREEQRTLGDLQAILFKVFGAQDVPQFNSLGFRMYQGLGFRIYHGLGFRIYHGLGFRMYYGLGSRIYTV